MCHTRPDTSKRALSTHDCTPGHPPSHHAAWLTGWDALLEFRCWKLGCEFVNMCENTDWWCENFSSFHSEERPACTNCMHMTGLRRWEHPGVRRRREPRKVLILVLRRIFNLLPPDETIVNFGMVGGHSESASYFCRTASLWNSNCQLGYCFCTTHDSILVRMLTCINGENILKL